MVEDITVYAKREDASMVKKTKVVFDLNGGDSAPIPEQEVPDHGRVAKPENPTKTGFDFVGWESGYNGYWMPFDIENLYTMMLTRITSLRFARVGKRLGLRSR